MITGELPYERERSLAAAKANFLINVAMAKVISGQNPDIKRLRGFADTLFEEVKDILKEGDSDGVSED